MTATLSCVSNCLVFSANRGQLEAGSTTTGSSFLPSTPPLALISSMAINTVSLSTVSEMAMVPDRLCRMPTLIVSLDWAWAGRTERPARATAAVSALRVKRRCMWKAPCEMEAHARSAPSPVKYGTWRMPEPVCQQGYQRTSLRPTDTNRTRLSNRQSPFTRPPMNQLLSRLSPSVTNMIRMDHTHVLTTFHQYEVDTPLRVKKGLADTVCVALEIHTQLEEEVFYPALRAIADTELLKKSVPEHDQMRRLITQLRNLEPAHATFDETFFELMNNVMHHVADEETLLLPAAERVLADRLGELGAQMTKRRLQLAAPRSGEIAGGMARSVGAGGLVMGAGALLACSYLLSRPRALRGQTQRTGSVAQR